MVKSRIHSPFLYPLFWWVWLKLFFSSPFVSFAWFCSRYDTITKLCLFNRNKQVLSNEATRIQYDRALKFRDDAARQHRRQRNYTSEFDSGVRIYRWDELRRRMQRERYWEESNVKEESSSSTKSNGVSEEGNTIHERGSFSEVLRSAFFSLFLLHMFGSVLSLTFSSLMALLDRKLDAGYKIGYVIAWILGGRGGILLTLSLSFASWACGKTSSSIVALVVVAMWVGSNLARYAPLPQGALLTLLYMSIKLQADLTWSIFPSAFCLETTFVSSFFSSLYIFCSIWWMVVVSNLRFDEKSSEKEWIWSLQILLSDPLLSFFLQLCNLHANFDPLYFCHLIALWFR